MITAIDTIYLISKLFGFAIVMQSIEYLKIRDSFSKSGIWRWEELRVEYDFLPEFLRYLLDFLMKDEVFIIILKLRLVLGLVILFFPSTFILLYLLVSTWLICLRWRGSFNGGSDYLTLIGLLCLAIAISFRSIPIVIKGAIWYLALQVIASYFISGVYKIKQWKWLNGTALNGFLSSPEYTVPNFILFIIKKRSVMQLLSILVILFEIAFPLVLFSKFFCILFLFTGALFHLANFWIFGLNRFFWIWTATYPAIYFCSKQFSF